MNLFILVVDRLAAVFLISFLSYYVIEKLFMGLRVKHLVKD